MSATHALLLPCPFCGASDVAPTGNMSWTEIWCPTCKAHGPSVYHGGPTDDRATLNRCQDEASTAWNRRTTAGQGQ